MTDNNNDVSMDPPTIPGHFELSGVHAGWRNQNTDRQRYASMRKGIIRVISRFVQSKWRKKRKTRYRRQRRMGTNYKERPSYW